MIWVETRGEGAEAASGRSAERKANVPARCIVDSECGVIRLKGRLTDRLCAVNAKGRRRYHRYIG
jgi:hypothetical protein